MIERAVVEYIANTFWQIPLLAAGAWLLLRAVKMGPRVQHGVWLAVLGLAVLLPLRGTVTDARDVPIGHEIEVPQVRMTDAFYGSHVQPGWQSIAREWVDAVPRMRRLHVSERILHWIVAAYAASVLFGLFRIARAWCVARRLVRMSWETTLSCRRSMEFFESYGQRFGTRLPRLRESTEVSSPMIVGVTEPVLLLPEGFGLHTMDEIKAALCHELAHVRRRDYLVNFICQVMALPVTWHPVTHAVQQRVRRTREMICDAMAAEEMCSEAGYARCLLAMARSMTGGRGFAEQTAGLGLFGNNVLEERVMSLMETKRVISVRAKVARVVSGASAMTAAVVAATMFHLAPTMAASSVEIVPVTMQSVQAVQQSEQSTQPVQPARPLEPAQPRQIAEPVQPVQTVQPVQPMQPVQPIASGVAEPDAAAVREQSQEEKKSAVEPKKIYRVHEKDGKKQSFAIVNGEARELTPEEKDRFERAMARAQERINDAMAKLNDPARREQMEQAQRKADEAVARVNSPEFKKQIEDAQRHAQEATAWVNSPEFKERMEKQAKVMADMQAAQAMRTQAMKDVMAKLNSPEYKRQMEEMREQVNAATAKLNSPEYQQRMKDLQKEMEEMRLDMKNRMKMKFDDGQERSGAIPAK